MAFENYLPFLNKTILFLQIFKDHFITLNNFFAGSNSLLGDDSPKQSRIQSSARQSHMGEKMQHIILCFYRGT
jgi:hypothetical protein